MIDVHKETFREEARELLLDLEAALLDLETEPTDQELIGRAFRAMHTIKGSGAMFGFENIAEFTHEIETVYDLVRQGEIQISRELINLTLIAKDIIKEMLDENPQNEVPSGQLPEVVNAFRLFTSKSMVDEISQSKPSNPSPPLGTSSPLFKTYRISFAPHNDIFMSGTNPIMLLKELCDLGEASVLAQLEDIPSISDINPEECYTSWEIILTTNKSLDTIRDVFIFVEDQCDLTINLIEDEQEETGAGKKIGEILVERGQITPEGLQEALSEKKLFGELLFEKGLVTKDKIEAALVEQQHLREVREKKKTKDESSTSIRVPSEKLDTLVNLVGELVTVQARLTQTAALKYDAAITSIAEEVERLTELLRDNTLNIRMLPIGATFGRFKRLVRDLSQELAKEIDLTTEGEDTELDKTVIERLNDPLVHLIRNSVDHGIESPEARLAKGKSKMGSIHLSARHSGGHVIIKIRDDGKGLDKEAILAKAIEKGFIHNTATLSEKEIFHLIFLPGFSTAASVTNVSGRGVGMDVVKSAMTALRGTVEVTSELDKGTEITIKLPLTLAIVDGLLVSISEQHFVLPLSIVEECVELTLEDIHRAHGRNMAHIRGDLIPYIQLRNEFAVAGECPPIQQIVVTGNNGRRVGFVVDKVVGEHQTVIKNLGKLYENLEGISGATILGDGGVALIVDAAKLIDKAEQVETRCN